MCHGIWRAAGSQGLHQFSGIIRMHGMIVKIRNIDFYVGNRIFLVNLEVFYIKKYDAL